MAPPSSKRAHGQRRALPLGPTTRKRMLAALLDKAEGGDILAMAELVRLSWEHERQVKTPAGVK